MIRPSGAGVWRWCSAAPHVEARYPPEPPGITTLNGSACHEVVRTETQNPDGPQLLELYNTPVDVVDEATGQVDTVYLDYEMLAAIKVCTDHIETLRQQIPHRQELIEERVEWNGIKGTPDFVIWDEANRVLHIIDWKFGFVEVSPEENWQLITYALGVIDTHNVDPERVVFHIGQPNAQVWPKVRKWSMSCNTPQLHEYAEQLKRAKDAVYSDDPTRTPGTHCYNCTGRIDCEAYNGMAGRMFQAFELLPETASADLPRLKEFYQLGKDMFAAGLKSVDQRIYAKLTNGEPVQGYGLKSIPGKKTIDKTRIEDIRLIGQLHGVKTIRDNPMTLTQMKNAGISEEWLTGLTTQAKGSTIVVRMDVQDELNKIFGDKKS